MEERRSHGLKRGGGLAPPLAGSEVASPPALEGAIAGSKVVSFAARLEARWGGLDPFSRVGSEVRPSPPAFVWGKG